MSALIQSLSGAASPVTGSVLSLHGLSDTCGMVATGGTVVLEGSLNGTDWYSMPFNYSGAGVRLPAARFLRARGTSGSPSASVYAAEIDYSGEVFVSLSGSTSSSDTGASKELLGLGDRFTLVTKATGDSTVILEGSLDGLTWDGLVTLNHSGSVGVEVQTNEWARGAIAHNHYRHIRARRTSGSASLDATIAIHSIH